MSLQITPALNPQGSRSLQRLPPRACLSVAPGKNLPCLGLPRLFLFPGVFLQGLGVSGPITPGPLRRTQENMGVLPEVGTECNWVDIPVFFKRNSSPWPRGRAAPWSGLCLSLLRTSTHFLSSAQGHNCFSCHFVRTDSCGVFFFFFQ